MQSCLRELPHGPVTVQMSSMVEALAPFAVSPNGERVVVATTMDQLIVTDAIGAGDSAVKSFADL